MPAMIDRRELMAALGSAAVAWPMTALAQQSIPVIGWVTGSMLPLTQSGEKEERKNSKGPG
jgi:hypothetical protein